MGEQRPDDPAWTVTAPSISAGDFVTVTSDGTVLPAPVSPFVVPSPASPLVTLEDYQRLQAQVAVLIDGLTQLNKAMKTQVRVNEAVQKQIAILAAQKAERGATK
jgi:hypothetical protein